MSDTPSLSIFTETRRTMTDSRIWAEAVLAAFVWLAATTVTISVPDQIQVPSHRATASAEFGVAILLVVAALLFAARVPLGIRRQGRRIAALALLVLTWEVVTAKTGWLPLPFFPSPEAVIDVFYTDSPRLIDSTLHSLLILAPGFFIGAFIGIACGIAMGWSQEAHYWGHPVVRVLGPLPAIAWLPVALFVFPSIYAASIFLIALATALPVSILTASGVAQVDRRFYDVGRTMGAKPGFLIRTIAIPSALPHIFVGLFMGLSASFAVLIIAEMMGAKSGLGWYLQWAQGWAAYANVYAVLALMSVLFSSLTAFLFTIRRHILRWHQELVEW